LQQTPVNEQIIETVLTESLPQKAVFKSKYYDNLRVAAPFKGQGVAGQRIQH